MNGPIPDLREIERLENTSFATAFAGGAEDNGPADTLGEGRTAVWGDNTIIDCILTIDGPYGTIIVCIESECSCGCIECGDTNPFDDLFTTPTAHFTAVGPDHAAEGILDIIRRG